MDNYPDTYKQFYHMFDTEDKCRKYLFQVKYTDGFVCDFCKGNKTWEKENGIFRCASCKKDISVTRKTIFHKRHLPLTFWFEAMWLTVFQKNGISGVGLAKALGLKREKTGWDMLQTLRKGMVRSGREKLQGLVEIDEIFIGGIKKGPRGRGALGKSLVLVAIEDKLEKGYGRARMKIIPDAKSETLISVIQDMVEFGSSIRTDEHRSYFTLPEHGFTHITTPKKSLEHGEDPTPLVHRISSLIKRWLLGTHQGGVHLENLEPYLDEFVFRFNRRTSKSRGKLFYRLVQGMLKVKG